MKVLAFVCIASPLFAGASKPVFYRDVLPILQSHCQRCHREGEIAPFPLVTYSQVRPYAAEIREQTGARNMPPWFADPCCGHFANDPSLAPEQIATLAAWADAHAPAGDPHAAPPEVHWSRGWNIDKPDVVVEMPRPVEIPAEGDVPYTYVIVPTHFTEARWVRMSEIRPGNRAIVHHAVAYIREPGSRWLKGAPAGVSFTALDLADPQLRREAMWTASDILLVYAPGSSPGQWPPGFAKLLPAGADIVLQMHYTIRTRHSRFRIMVCRLSNRRIPRNREVASHFR